MVGTGSKYIVYVLSTCNKKYTLHVTNDVLNLLTDYSVACMYGFIWLVIITIR